MSRATFARATKRILAHLGQDAFLRGEPAGKIHVEHDVQVSQGDAIFLRSVASIETVFGPSVKGDEIELGSIVKGKFVGEETWVIDGPAISNNGHMVRHVVRKA